MFDAIKSFIRNTRINFDYQTFEREQRDTRMVEAERRFDISHLDMEVGTIRRRAASAGDQRYGGEIASLRQHIAATEVSLQKHRELLSYFERNYRAELDQLYARKTQLYEEQENLIAEAAQLREERADVRTILQDAYDDLEDAKDDVDSWHARSTRSTWLFGNRGKKLPSRSLFGQSFGDLSEAKSRRGVAVSDIVSAKSRLTEVKARYTENKEELVEICARIGSVNEKIVAIKNDRTNMNSLRKEGIVPADLRTTIKTIQSTLLCLVTQLQLTENDLAALVSETQERMGLSKKELAISNLLEQKREFLEQFSSKENRASRREAHRQQWMARHE